MSAQVNTPEAQIAQAMDTLDGYGRTFPDLASAVEAVMADLNNYRVAESRLRRALEVIYESRHYCGCMPVCRCNDNVQSLLAWKEAALDGAKAALDGKDVL